MEMKEVAKLTLLGCLSAFAISCAATDATDDGTTDETPSTLTEPATICAPRQCLMIAKNALQSRFYGCYDSGAFACDKNDPHVVYQCWGGNWVKDGVCYNIPFVGWQVCNQVGGPPNGGTTACVDP